MKKSILIPSVTGISFLCLALVSRWLNLPDQILLILAGFISFFLVGHIFYLASRMSGKATKVGKAFELLVFVWLILLVVFLSIYFYSGLKDLWLIPWGLLLGSGLLVYLLPVLRGKATGSGSDLLFAGFYVLGIVLLFLTNPIKFQIPDKFYHPLIEDSAYPAGKGPIVLIDEAHHNFHTISGRYFAFAKVLRMDGYRVEPLTRSLDRDVLENCSMLVIANAQNKKNVEDWTNPVYPAFTKKEVDLLEEWVSGGGSLFLIADHMPMAGAVSDIGDRFGFTMYNGFNLDTIPGPELFCLADSSLMDCPLIYTSGGERIDSILTFTGHGFDYPPTAVPVLRFGKGSYILLPDTAWAFHASTPRLDAEGMAQLAYKNHGKGRVVISGEAAMFSSQYFGGLSWRKGGMGTPGAGNNYKLLLNIVHWLDPDS